MKMLALAALLGLMPAAQPSPPDDLSDPLILEITALVVETVGLDAEDCATFTNLAEVLDVPNDFVYHWAIGLMVTDFATADPDTGDYAVLTPAAVHELQRQYESCDTKEV